MQQLQVNRQGAVKIKSACIQKKMIPSCRATWFHQVARGEHHTASLRSLLQGAAMQPCSALSGWQHSKPTSLPIISQTGEEELKSFLTISLSPHFIKINEVTDFPPFQRPPLLLRLQAILKAFLYLWGGRGRNHQKLVLLRCF